MFTAITHKKERSEMLLLIQVKNKPCVNHVVQKRITQASPSFFHRLIMGVNAEKWFKENAFFRMPLYKRDSGATAPSRGVKRTSVDRLNNSRVPISAYRDPTKVSRLIDVADRALRPRNLVAPPGFTRDSVIKKEYAKLFSPACEGNLGVLYSAWKQIYSKTDVSMQPIFLASSSDLHSAPVFSASISQGMQYFTPSGSSCR